MHKSQVSIELWERFIDHVGIESDMDPIAYYPAIRTCCLVCALWLPRSRYNLYRIVFITGGLSRSGQAQVLCLARTVCERRDIACLINELRIRPRTLGRTVPLVVVAGSAGPGGWASSMISLRCLKLVGISWYPGQYFTAISRLPALAHLELRRVAFNSASHLFHLIWSLPHLVSLDLHQVTIRKVSQMKFGESCWTCPKAVLGSLTELSISVRTLRSRFECSLMLACTGKFGRYGILPASQRARSDPPEGIPRVLFEALAYKYVCLTSVPPTDHLDPTQYNFFSAASRDAAGVEYAGRTPRRYPSGRRGNTSRPCVLKLVVCIVHEEYHQTGEAGSPPGLIHEGWLWSDSFEDD